MRDYIVRIYRQSEDELVGLVEDVTENIKIPFRNRDELWSALLGTGIKKTRRTSSATRSRNKRTST